MITKKFNKKGLVFDLTEMLWKFLLTLVILFVIGWVTFSYLNEKFETENLENSLLFNKFVSSPNCLAFNDGKFLNQGLIDFNKLDKEKLRDCKFKEDTSVILTLKDINYKGVKKVSIGSDRDLNLILVCDTYEGFICFKKTSYILYQKDGINLPGFLEMESIKNV